MTAVDSVSCVHHWVIEIAAGPTSLGTCQKCMESRQFHNNVYGITVDKGARSNTTGQYQSKRTAFPGVGLDAQEG